MQTSGIPARVAVPFADSGTKNTIPVPSQVAVTPGLASYTTGFPPLTMTPITAGGVPPYGADFNGILNAITNAIRWNSAGSGYPFDSTFAGTVSGYPKGALVPSSDYTGYWLNTTEANSTTPENTTAVATGWVPILQYGVTAITGLTNTSVTLTTLQAAKQRLTLAGTLTANINLIFPAWLRNWTVANNCTGSFSITCKTPSGTGVTIPIGVTASISCDGVNIYPDNLLVSGNLSEISRVGSVAQAAARTNLGLGSAATTNVGTGSGMVPDMSSFTSGASGASFWQKLPSGILMQYGYVFGMSSGAITTTYPVPFTSLLRSLLVTPTGNVGANSVNSAIPSVTPASGTSLTAFSVTGYNASTGGTPQISNVLFYWEAIGV